MAGQTNITIDYEVARRKLTTVSAKLGPFFRIMARKVAGEALRIVKMYTPPTSPGRTNIKELWMMETTREGTAEIYTIANTYQKNPDVILFFEEGTVPHIIRPRKCKRLRFFIEGQEIFSKLVHHPGTPAYHMVEQAQRETDYIINQYVDLTLKTLNEVLEAGGKI
jgi:hypothetical protein